MLPLADVVSISQLQRAECVAEKAPAKFVDFGFKVSLTGQTYYFTAESQNDRLKILDALSLLYADQRNPVKPPERRAVPFPQLSSSKQGEQEGSGEPSVDIGGGAQRRGSSSLPPQSSEKSAEAQSAAAPSTSQRRMTTVQTAPPNSIPYVPPPPPPVVEEVSLNWDGEGAAHDEFAEDDEESEFEMLSHAVQQGAWMHKPPSTSTTVEGGVLKRAGFLGGAWKRRFVWVRGDAVLYGESENLAKVEKSIPLSTVRGVRTLTTKEAEDLRAPDRLSRLGWLLQTDRVLVFAAENPMSREMFVAYFEKVLARRFVQRDGARNAAAAGNAKHRATAPAAARQQTKGDEWDEMDDTPQVAGTRQSAPNNGRPPAATIVGRGTTGNGTGAAQAQQQPLARDRSSTMQPQPAPAGSLRESESRTTFNNTSTVQSAGPQKSAAPAQRAESEEVIRVQSMPSKEETSSIGRMADLESDGEDAVSEPVAPDVSASPEPANGASLPPKGPNFSTALPLSTLSGFANMIAAAMRPDKDEGLSGAAVHDRDGLLITRVGDCDTAIVGKATSLFNRMRALEDQPVLQVLIETDKRSITVGTLSSTANDPFLLTTQHTSML